MRFRRWFHYLHWSSHRIRLHYLGRQYYWLHLPHHRTPLYLCFSSPQRFRVGIPPPSLLSLSHGSFPTSFAKYFGSGVIIATAFIHLLSPAIDELSSPCLGPAWRAYVSTPPSPVDVNSIVSLPDERPPSALCSSTCPSLCLLYIHRRIVRLPHRYCQTQEARN